MKRILLPCLSLLAALALPGCLQQATTLHLNKDGSGTLVEETTFGAQMVAMLEQFAGIGGDKAKDPIKELASPDKAQSRAAALGEGVTVEKVEAIEVNGNKGARVTYRFADINKLQLSVSGGLQEAMPKMPGAPEADKRQKDLTYILPQGTSVTRKSTPEADKPQKDLTYILPQATSVTRKSTPEANKPKEKPTTFKYAAGVLTITNPDQDKPEAAVPAKPEGAPALGDESQQAMMKQVMGDMKMSLNVVIEPGIASTDATHVAGNTVTLMDMDMGKLMENPEVFKTLGNMDQNNRAQAMAALKNLKGVKVETQKAITIKLK